MSRNLNLAPGEFYHIYNRGTEKRDIFTSRVDYERFVALLYLCNSLTPVRVENVSRHERSEQGWTLLRAFVAFEFDRGEPLVEIATYCLMPNHFHLLIREKEEGGASKFMQKVLTGYTMYFNKKYERTGALFQSRFKASHVDNDRYLKYLISYIHLNPIKLIDPKWKENGIRNRTEAEQYLKEYRHSSFLDYIGVAREENAILAKEALPEYFESAGDFAANVTEWLTYRFDESEK